MDRKKLIITTSAIVAVVVTIVVIVLVVRQKNSSESTGTGNGGTGTGTGTGNGGTGNGTGNGGTTNPPDPTTVEDYAPPDITRAQFPTNIPLEGDYYIFIPAPLDAVDPKGCWLSAETCNGVPGSGNYTDTARVTYFDWFRREPQLWTLKRKGAGWSLSNKNRAGCDSAFVGFHFDYNMLGFPEMNPFPPPAFFMKYTKTPALGSTFYTNEDGAYPFNIETVGGSDGKIVFHADIYSLFWDKETNATITTYDTNGERWAKNSSFSAQGGTGRDNKFYLLPVKSPIANIIPPKLVTKQYYLINVARNDCPNCFLSAQGCDGSPTPDMYHLPNKGMQIWLIIQVGTKYVIVHQNRSACGGVLSASALNKPVMVKNDTVVSTDVATASAPTTIDRSQLWAIVPVYKTPRQYTITNVGQSMAVPKKPCNLSAALCSENNNWTTLSTNTRDTEKWYIIPV